MVERNDYPPGVPCWVDTLQPDPRATMRFYEDVMGWTFEGPGPMPGNPPGDYYIAKLRGREVAGVGTQPMPGAPSTWNTYVAVESADDAAKKVKPAGGKVVREPFDVPPAGRVAVCTDPADAVFCLWEAGDRAGAQAISEIGAWAMSSLSTPDPEGAKKFYAAVFGWKSEAMKMNGGEITLFRQPGFVGGPPEQPVPRDVVAVMMPAKAGSASGGGPPSWLVGFWVPDADATIEKTKKLGGKVVMPATDIPRFRYAILADPQGAVFSVSEPKREK